MKKGFRRGGWGKTKVDLDGVPLVGPNPVTVFREEETLLVVGCDDVLELIAGGFPSMSGELFEKLVDVNPALGIEGDSNR